MQRTLAYFEHLTIEDLDMSAAMDIESSQKDAAEAQTGNPHLKRLPRRREDESPDVKLSKTLSYILRHGAAKEGLKVRSDGFVRVDELVRRARVLLAVASSPD